MKFIKDEASGIVARSNGSPAGDRFIDTLGTVIQDHNTQQRYSEDWLKGFRRVKAIHPDDGWVDREKNSVHLCYPSYNAGPQVGDLIALGWHWAGYRFVEVTSITSLMLDPSMIRYNFRPVWRKFYIPRES